MPRLSLFALGKVVGKNRNERARDGSSRNQEEEEVGNREGCVVDIGMEALPELVRDNTVSHKP